MRGERDPVLLLGLTWVASCLAFLPAFDSAQVSRTALVLAPWLVLAGWPAGRGAAGGPVPTGFLSSGFPAVGLALPLLALGVELDRASAWSSPEAFHTALLGTALVLVSTAASAAAARAGGPLADGYALAWLVTFLLLPLLLLVSRPASSGGWVGALGAASPIAWCLARVRSESQGSAPAGLGSLALVVILWLVVAVPRSRRSGSAS